MHQTFPSAIDTQKGKKKGCKDDFAASNTMNSLKNEIQIDHFYNIEHHIYPQI